MLIACGLAVVLAAARGGASQLPTAEGARKQVDQIVALAGGIVLVKNELGAVAETRDGGKTWRPWKARAGRLALSDGDRIWAYGVAPLVREVPRAEVARTADRGRTWTRGRLVPEDIAEVTNAALPARFLNPPDGAPLVLMHDHQLLRPDPAWPRAPGKKVGVPVPLPVRTPGRWEGDALEHRGAYYVAAASHIFMSIDGAQTWTAAQLPAFTDARLRCRGDTCFALLVRPGTLWSGLFTVRAGENAWKELEGLDAKAQAALSHIAGTRPAVRRFLAQDLLVTDEDVYLVGVVDPRDSSWGAVLHLDPQGGVHAVGDAVDGWLWAIERDSQGTLWIGGDGAFRLRGDRWAHVWPAR
jgi:hypothetical protein